MTKPLLIVWHSRTGASEQMALAAASAAGELAHCERAEQVDATMILGARGYLFVCPENLATMSGQMKEMFDRTYYEVLGRIEGRAYATIIAAGSDGSGAQRQIDRIAKGWRLRRVSDPLIVNFSAQEPDEILARKTVSPETLASCSGLGMGLAEGLQAGIF